MNNHFYLTNDPFSFISCAVGFSSISAALVMPCRAGDIARSESRSIAAQAMNLIDRLQDPQLVAEFQHLFGVRRKDRERDARGGAAERLEAAGASSENLLGRYLGEQECQNGVASRRSCQHLSVPDARHKTHFRQGSTASVASDCSTGSGEGQGTASLPRLCSFFCNPRARERFLFLFSLYLNY